MNQNELAPMRDRISGSSFLAVGLIFSGLFFSGCGLDRNQDDYKREKEREDLAKIEAVSGTYSGYAYSPSGQLMGALEIELSGTIAPSGPEAPGGAQGSRARIRPTVTLKQHNTYTAVFNESEFDTGAQIINAPLKIEGNQGIPNSASDLLLNAQIRSNELVGSIIVQGLSERGLRFSLKKGGSVNDHALSPTELPNPPLGVDRFRLFQSPIVRSGDRRRYYEIRVSQLNQSNEAEFLSIISPRVYVDLNFTLQSVDSRGRPESDAIVITFFNSFWDQNTGLLSARSNTNSGGITAVFTLQCKRRGAASTRESYDCLRNSTLNPDTLRFVVNEVVD